MPTRLGRDFRPVLIALLAWGNRNFAPEGASVVIVDAVSGETAESVLVDQKTGRPLLSREFILAAGPAASDAIRRRYAPKAEAMRTAVAQGRA